jgi:hypothetical protein
LVLAAAMGIERIEWSERERDRLKPHYAHEVKQGYLSEREAASRQQPTETAVPAAARANGCRRLLKEARVARRKSIHCMALTV